MSPRRALLVCPGRGSYRADCLGSLQGPSPIIDVLDHLRSGWGRPTLRELDGADRFSGRLHLAGEHASLLTFGASATDIVALDPARVKVVAVTGNSMGWYTALFAAGALDLMGAASLVEHMGAWQAGNVVGGQVLYPVVDADWRPDPVLQARVDAACQDPEVHLSIRLGGTAVLGASAEALRRLLRELPLIERGTRRYPLQLPLHSAFHTPLMQATSERAQLELAELPLRSPALSLVDGQGRVYRPWADPAALRDYTLGAQVTQTYDLSLALRTALADFAPEAVVVAGPGDSLGAAVAQVLVAEGWWGLRDRQDFLEAQAGEAPPVISMGRTSQRALVA